MPAGDPDRPGDADRRPAPTPHEDHTAPPRGDGSTPDTAAFACDLCGGPMRETHCKLICDQCGYTRDCSDP